MRELEQLILVERARDLPLCGQAASLNEFDRKPRHGPSSLRALPARLVEVWDVRVVETVENHALGDELVDKVIQQLLELGRGMG